MLTQLNHPDSGIQADTLITFFLNQLVNTVNTWMDIDKGLKEERQGRYLDKFCSIYLKKIKKSWYFVLS